MIEPNDNTDGDADNRGEAAERNDADGTAEDSNSHKKPTVEQTAHFLEADKLDYEFEAPEDLNRHHGEYEDRMAKRRASHLRASQHGIVVDGTPFDVSFRPGRLVLYARPRQRQNWGDTQVLPRVNWGDLFFDLYYVAAAYNVSFSFSSLQCSWLAACSLLLISLEMDIQHLGGFSQWQRLLVFYRNLLSTDGYVDGQDLL
jgi:hypothetical protein